MMYVNHVVAEKPGQSPKYADTYNESKGAM